MILSRSWSRTNSIKDLLVECVEVNLVRRSAETYLNLVSTSVVETKRLPTTSPIIIGLDGII